MFQYRSPLTNFILEEFLQGFASCTLHCSVKKFRFFGRPVRFRFRDNLIRISGSGSGSGPALRSGSLHDFISAINWFICLKSWKFPNDIWCQFVCLHCDPFDHNLIFDFNCYCQHHWFCFWQSMTEFRRIPQLEYDTAFHFFDMKYESYCLEIWHYWDNTQYMLIKVYYYDKQIKSSKVETVSVINTSMCVYFCLLKMLLSL